MNQIQSSTQALDLARQVLRIEAEAILALGERLDGAFLDAVNLILAGRLPDLTNGALFFQNAEIVAARAARGRVSSYLVDFGGTPPVAEIGDHRFYDWRAGINLGVRRQRSVEPETYAVYSEPDGAAEAYVAAAQEATEATDFPAQPEPPTEAVAEAQQEPVVSANDVAFALPAEGECAFGAAC